MVSSGPTTRKCPEANMRESGKTYRISSTVKLTILTFFVVFKEREERGVRRLEEKTWYAKV
jgi:hypothetical protein